MLIQRSCGAAYLIGDNMNFEEYKSGYIKLAKKADYNDVVITRQLQYANNLYDRQLPIIYDAMHFSKLVGIELEYLYGVANAPSKYYRKNTVRKKKHGKRILYEPLPLLKETQKWINRNILEKLESSVYTKAYKKGSSIKANARFHKRKKIVVTLDIQDYFGSIKYISVLKFFRDLGYYKNVAVLLANLCCLKGALPQGTPTSPALSNLLTISLDKRLYGVAKQFEARYTRYSDDITFSGDEINPNKIIGFTKRILESEGYQLNQRKVKIRNDYQKQIVTGIVVNHRMRIDKSELKRIRQEVYYIEKFGFDSHYEKISSLNNYKDKTSYIRSLYGRINHAVFINPMDQEMISYRSTIGELLK